MNKIPCVLGITLDDEVPQPLLHGEAVDAVVAVHSMDRVGRQLHHAVAVRLGQYPAPQLVLSLQHLHPRMERGDNVSTTVQN